MHDIRDLLECLLCPQQPDAVWRLATKAVKHRLQRNASRGGLIGESLDQEFAIQVELVNQEVIRCEHLDFVRLDRCRQEVSRVVRDDCVRA